MRDTVGTGTIFEIDHATCVEIIILGFPLHNGVIDGEPSSAEISSFGNNKVNFMETMTKEKPPTTQTRTTAASATASADGPRGVQLMTEAMEAAAANTGGGRYHGVVVGATAPTTPPQELWVANLAGELQSMPVDMRDQVVGALKESKL